MTEYEMQDIKELNLKDLERIFKNWSIASFRAQQVFSWIYKKGVRDFAAMDNLSLDLRKRLQQEFFISDLKLTRILKSKDGTEKLLLSLREENFIEAVIIPTKKRITGCISTQVGCKFACAFCASGVSGFKRNLTCGELIDEVLLLREKSPERKLSHLVFMGSGEPLDNYDNVLKAIRIINSPDTFNIGARKITISTCGIIPAINKLANEGLQIELSISIHAADEKTRSQIMPVNKIYPLKELIPACQEYIQKTNRQLTFEYVLIRGVNSTLPDAQKLSTILKGLKLCKVNLIPCNSVKELKVEPPARRDILLFKDFLLKQGVNVTLRRPRGEDIEASCGQLRLRYENR